MLQNQSKSFFLDFSNTILKSKSLIKVRYYCRVHEHTGWCGERREGGCCFTEARKGGFVVRGAGIPHF